MRQFNPEQEVPSLELCKRLKELGYPQEGGGWYWIKKSKEKQEYILVFNVGKYNSDTLVFILPGEKTPYFRRLAEDEIYKAPTLGEMGEWLPDSISLDGYKSDLVFNKRWYAYRSDLINEPHFIGIKETSEIKGDTEPNARAKMLIWLAENGYVDFKEKKGADNDR